jgi:Protein of unknown function (DUF2934)
VGRANPIQNRKIAVPKKTKTASKEVEQSSVGVAAEPNPLAEKPSRRAPAKAKKSATRKPTKRTSVKSTSRSGASVEPTDEEIRIRAYFISERRHRLALPGDATADWAEARRQLLAELAKR